MAMGLTDPEIAHQMQVKVNTARTTLKNVRRKWGVTNRIEIAILAIGTIISLEEAQDGIRRIERATP